MDATLAISFAVVFVLGVVLIISHFAGKRAKALQQAAAELNLQYQPKDDGTLLDSLGRFNLFQHGRRKRILNIMMGSYHGTPLKVFDYQYTTGGGRSTHTWSQTVLLFSDKLELPEFILKPENLFHRIGKVFGYQDINFEQHPQFSGNYLLQGADEEAVRRCFRENVLSYLDAHRGISLQGEGAELLYFRLGKRPAAAALREFLDNGLEVYALFRKRSFY